MLMTELACCLELGLVMLVLEMFDGFGSYCYDYCILGYSKWIEFLHYVRIGETS